MRATRISLSIASGIIAAAGLVWCAQAQAMAALPGGANRLTLVRDGQPNAVIVTAAKPLPSQQLAAEELQYHIAKMSGAKLPILSETQALTAAQTVILVGQSARLAGLGIDTAALPLETMIVKTFSNALALAGEDGVLTGNPETRSPFSSFVRCGTMFAVYDFLQDQLGCRWIWPGETGEVIPPRRTIEIGDLDIRETPLLVKRHFRPVLGKQRRKQYEQQIALAPYLDMQATYEKLSRDEELWLRRMRMGGSFYGHYGHAFTDWWDRYGATHPDIFALLPDGKRGPAGKPEMVKMCVSNPKLWELQIEEFKKYLDNKSFNKSLNACENDGGRGWCTCAKCRAWDAPMDQAALDQLKKEGWDVGLYTNKYLPAEDGLPKSLGYRYARWYNELARRARAIDSNAFVMAYSYGRFKGPPLGLKLEPNILIGLVSFNLYPMTAEQRNSQRGSLADWEMSGGHFFFRPNSFHFTGHAVPFNVTREMAQDFQFLVRSGVRNTDFDSLLGFWATAGPMYYALARLHWDTAADIKTLEDEYYQAFGPMAGIVREYFDYWERWTRKAWLQPDLPDRLKALSSGSSRRARIMILPELYTAKDMAAGRAILDKAGPLLAGATEAQRASFENIALGLQHAELMTRGTQLTLAARKSRTGDIRALAQATRDLVAFRRRIAARNVVNVYWCTYLEQLFGLVQSLDLARDLADREGLVALRHNNWKVRFDPDLAGENAPEPWYAKKSSSGWSSENLRGQTWDAWKLNKKWKEKHGRDYSGTAWARIGFTAPQPDEGKRLGLRLAGVKGGTKVWIDSVLAGERPRTGKEEPGFFDLDITGLVTPGRASQLVVKITSPEAPGGLVRGAYVFQYQDGLKP